MIVECIWLVAAGRVNEFLDVIRQSSTSCTAKQANDPNDTVLASYSSATQQTDRTGAALRTNCKQECCCYGLLLWRGRRLWVCDMHWCRYCCLLPRLKSQWQARFVHWQHHDALAGMWIHYNTRLTSAPCQAVSYWIAALNHCPRSLLRWSGSTSSEDAEDNRQLGIHHCSQRSVWSNLCITYTRRYYSSSTVESQFWSP